MQHLLVHTATVQYNEHVYWKAERYTDWLRFNTQGWNLRQKPSRTICHYLLNWHQQRHKKNKKYIYAKYSGIERRVGWRGGGGARGLTRLTIKCLYPPQSSSCGTRTTLRAVAASGYPHVPNMHCYFYWIRQDISRSGLKPRFTPIIYIGRICVAESPCSGGLISKLVSGNSQQHNIVSYSSSLFGMG